MVLFGMYTLLKIGYGFPGTLDQDMSDISVRIWQMCEPMPLILYESRPWRT